MSPAATATGRASRKSTSRPFSVRSASGRRGSRMLAGSPNTSIAPIASRPPAGPGPWCWRSPRTCSRTRSRPWTVQRFPPFAEEPDPGAIQAMFELLKEAAAPVAIVGGADWSPRAAHHFANFAFRYGIPVAAAFRRQDAIDNKCGVYAGQLGYGPNPKLQQRIREADLIIAIGPRLGEVDDRRLLAAHAGPSRPDSGARPPRPERTGPCLPRGPADLRGHG